MEADHITIAIWIVFISSLIWLYIDAKKIGVRKGVITGLGNMSLTGWLVSAVAFWIFVFPFYMFKRSKFIQKKDNTSAVERENGNDLTKGVWVGIALYGLFFVLLFLSPNPEIANSVDQDFAETVEINDSQEEADNQLVLEGFPECNSKEALLAVQTVFPVEDILDAREIPHHSVEAAKKLANERMGVDIHQVLVTNKGGDVRECIGIFITGVKQPAKYSFERMNNGISDEGAVFVTFEILTNDIYQAFEDPNFLALINKTNQQHVVPPAEDKPVVENEDDASAIIKKMQGQKKMDKIYKEKLEATTSDALKYGLIVEACKNFVSEYPNNIDKTHLEYAKGLLDVKSLRAQRKANCLGMGDAFEDLVQKTAMSLAESEEAQILQSVYYSAAGQDEEQRSLVEKNCENFLRSASDEVDVIGDDANFDESTCTFLDDKQ